MFKIIRGYFSPYKANPSPSLNLSIRERFYVCLEIRLVQLLSSGLLKVFRDSVCLGLFKPYQGLVSTEGWLPVTYGCLVATLQRPQWRSPSLQLLYSKSRLSNLPVIFGYSMDSKVKHISVHLSTSCWYLQTLKGCSPDQQSRHLP